jgi:hypothetical protein
MVTAVGVLEWIQETQLYTQASKQVPLDRVAQPLRNLAVTVDENLINGDVAKKMISDLQDRALKTASPAVESVRCRSNAACAFVRTSALAVSSLASSSLSTIKNIQEQYPIAKSNYLISQLISLICLVLSSIVSFLHDRFPEKPKEALPAPAAPTQKTQTPSQSGAHQRHATGGKKQQQQQQQQQQE